MYVRVVVFFRFFFFFFFKQKTAYEMRISDWSSDVCSSDLSWNFATARAKLARADTAPAFGPAYAYALPADWIRCVTAQDSADGGVLLAYRIEGGRLPSRSTCATSGGSPTPTCCRPKTGRATGRERVCKYVLDLGVPGII